MVVVMRIRHSERPAYETAADLPCPQVIRDGVDDLWNPVDGTVITSKRAYYRQLDAQGLAIDERPVMRDINNPQYDDAGLRQDIARAIREPAPEPSPEHLPELD